MNWRIFISFLVILGQIYQSNMEIDFQSQAFKYKYNSDFVSKPSKQAFLIFIQETEHMVG